MQALHDLLSSLNKSALDSITQNSLHIAPDVADNSVTDSNTLTPVSALLHWPDEPRLNCVVTVPPTLLIYCNLLPFAHIPLTALPIDHRSERIQEFQATSLEFSQPDDPFDELYISMTARERRKRQPGTGNTKVEAPAANTDSGQVPGDIERTETDIPEVRLDLISIFL